jgi:lysophospholipase L1-like esterase
MPMGIGIGLSMVKGGGVGVTLPYSPVLWLMGDSQGRGTMSTAGQASAVAAYTPTANVLLWNGTAWVTYTPGTSAGVDFGSVVGNVGSEIGYIAAFRAKYPNNKLYVVKDTAAGSAQTRGNPVGSAFNITGGSNTYTVNSGTLFGSNTLITGTGIETGVYIPFSGFLAKVGLNGGRSGAGFGPGAVTQYNGTLSWSITEGLVYQGNSAGINNAAHARLVAALASLTSPRLVSIGYCLGTNDKSFTSVGSAFATDIGAFFTQVAADVDTSHAVWSILRPLANGGPSDAAVRTALANQAATSPSTIKVVDMDAYGTWDGVHFDLDGETYFGQQTFANTVF